MSSFYTLALFFLLALTAKSFAGTPRGLKLELEAIHHDFSMTGRQQPRGVEKKKVTKYYATLGVGSRKASNSVLLDTASYNLWVMGKDLICDYYAGPYPPYTLSPSLVPDTSSNTCSDWGAFDMELSHTFRKNHTVPQFRIDYMDDSYVSGVWGADDIVLSHKLVRMSLGVAKKTSCSEGILGVGLVSKEVAVGKEITILANSNLPARLKDLGITRKNVYSLFLNASTSHRGSISFGYLDHKKYAGQLLTVPIVDVQKNQETRDEVAIRLSRMYLENDKQKVVILDSPIAAILDTGTVIQHFPLNVFSALGVSMQGTLTSAGIFMIDCSYMYSGNLVYDFSGIVIKVALDELILERNDMCYMGIKSFDNDLFYATAVLGTSFLRNAYVVFNLEDMEISMAQASYTTQEDLEEVSNVVPRALKAPWYSATRLAKTVSAKTPSVFVPVK